MSQSFDVRDPLLSPAAGGGPRRRILLTGAGGRIGSYFAEHSHQKYDLRLTDISFGERRAALGAFGELLEGELDDLDFLKRACAGVDTLVHMAGVASPSAVWKDLLAANIVGAYQACVAARAAGCRRIIYASSIHAVSGYPADVQVKTHEPVNPGDLYGVTKCFGEALGRYLSGQEGISFIALRIGAFLPSAVARDASKLNLLHSFVSRRDLNQLINRCIDAPDSLRFAIFHGLSDNSFKRLDISDARELVGYVPQDDSFAEHPETRDLHLNEIMDRAVQGNPARSGIREQL